MGQIIQEAQLPLRNRQWRGHGWVFFQGHCWDCCKSDENFFARGYIPIPLILV